VKGRADVRLYWAGAGKGSAEGGEGGEGEDADLPLHAPEEWFGEQTEHKNNAPRSSGYKDDASGRQGRIICEIVVEK